MTSFRLTILAVLVAAGLAGCFTYFVVPLPLPQIEVDQKLPPAAPDSKAPDRLAPANVDSGPSAKEQAVATFQRAAEAILRKLPDAQAFAATDEPPIIGHIPLPKRRPIPR